MKLRPAALALGSFLLCGLASPAAEAGQGCTDACTTNVGPPCVDSQGFGCVMGQCNTCTVDLHCAPGGTCDMSTGVGVCNTVCPIIPDGGTADGGGPDGGPDGGSNDAGTNDAGSPDAGGVDDAGPRDTGPALDAGPPDTGVRRDAMTTVSGGGTGNGRDEMFDEGCGCNTSADDYATAPLGLATVVGLWIGLRRRR